MNSADENKRMVRGIRRRLFLGIILAIITYRGVMLCEMTDKLHIPLYHVMVIGAAAIGTACAVLGYIILVKAREDNRAAGCLQLLLATLAFLYLIATAVPVFYATLDSMVPGVIFNKAESYTGEITSVGAPVKYPRVIPFTPKVLRYDCDYKYFDGDRFVTSTKTYTGSFNTTVKYEIGDEVYVRVIDEKHEHKYVAEYERQMSDQDYYQIGGLVLIYLIMFGAFVPFGRAERDDDDKPELDDD